MKKLFKQQTVASVFECAVSDIKKIQQDQKIESEKATQKQKELQKKFQAESAENEAKIDAANKEVTLASKVIENFSELFGVSKK